MREKTNITHGQSIAYYGICCRLAFDIENFRTSNSFRSPREQIVSERAREGECAPVKAIYTTYTPHSIDKSIGISQIINETQSDGHKQYKRQ